MNTCKKCKKFQTKEVAKCTSGRYVRCIKCGHVELIKNFAGGKK